MTGDVGVIGGAKSCLLLRFCFLAHADDVSVLKHICVRKNSCRGKILFSLAKFYMASFQLVLLIVYCIFSTSNILIVTWLSFSGFAMLMLSSIFYCQPS